MLPLLPAAAVAVVIQKSIGGRFIISKSVLVGRALPTIRVYFRK